jgi:NADP-dependent 3-hydroxy acid dehydrogenase YdfG
VLTAKLDVLDQACVDDAANCFAQDFGGLDILINNVGWLETAAPIVESDPKEWWYTMEVNIKGTYLSTCAFLPILLKGGMKTIVNLSSVGAHMIAAGVCCCQAARNEAMLKRPVFELRDSKASCTQIRRIHHGRRRPRYHTWLVGDRADWCSRGNTANKVS